MHGICALVGVKLIAIDRPGSGGTPRCASQDRMHVSLSQTISVLVSLGLVDIHLRRTGREPITLLAHSAGIFYALQLIEHFATTTETSQSHTTASFGTGQGSSRKHASPFGRRPRLLLSSPWVPTSASKSSLSLIPPAVIKMNSSVMPGVMKVFGAFNASMGTVTKQSKGCFGWSAGVARAASGPSTGVPLPSPKQNKRRRSLIPQAKAETAQTAPLASLDTPRCASSCAATRAPSFEDGTFSRDAGFSDVAQLAEDGYDNINPFLSVIGPEPPPSPTDDKGRHIRDESRRKHPGAAFHPPHELHYRYSMCRKVFSDRTTTHPATGKPFLLDDSTAGTQLLSEMMASEGYKGMTEDFLLSLGLVPGTSNAELEEIIQRGIDACSKSAKGAEITIVWASNDKLVPFKGRKWLDDVVCKAVANSPLDSRNHKRLRFDRLEMVDAGHDEPMGSEAVIVEILRRAKYGAAASSLSEHAYWSSIPRSSVTIQRDAPKPAAAAAAAAAKSSGRSMLAPHHVNQPRMPSSAGKIRGQDEFAPHETPNLSKDNRTIFNNPFNLSKDNRPTFNNPFAPGSNKVELCIDIDADDRRRREDKRRQTRRYSNPVDAFLADQLRLLSPPSSSSTSTRGRRKDYFSPTLSASSSPATFQDESSKRSISSLRHSSNIPTDRNHSPGVSSRRSSISSQSFTGSFLEPF
ncbi:unnamed protein product [Sympodiomycopsis kandeliae]